MDLKLLTPLGESLGVCVRQCSREEVTHRVAESPAISAAFDGCVRHVVENERGLHEPPRCKRRPRKFESLLENIATPAARIDALDQVIDKGVIWVRNIRQELNAVLLET